MATSSDAIKAGRAFVEISANDKDFNKVMDRVVKRFSGLGAFLQDTGKKFAVAGAAILAPIGASFLSAIRHADKIQDIADRMETTTEAVSRLGYAADFSASKIEDIEAASKLLARSAIAASRGSKEQVAAFQKMGVTAADFLALEADQRFVKIAESLEQITDPLERNNFLISLLGKSASTVLPLLAGGAANLRKLFEEAESTGSVVSGEDAAKSAKVADMMDKAWKEVKNTIFEVGLTFLGFTDDLTKSSNTFSTVLANIRKWIRDNRVLIAGVAILAAGITALGLAMVALSIPIFATIAAYKLLAAVAATTYAVLTSPILGIAGIIASVVIIIGGLTGKLKNFFSGFSETFKSIGNTFSKMWTGIQAALRKGDLESLFKIVQYGIQAIFLDMLVLLRSKWNDFANYFRDVFNDAVLAVQTSMLNLVKAIQIGFLSAIKFAVEQVNKAYAAMVNLLDPVEKRPLKPENEAKIQQIRRTTNPYGVGGLGRPEALERRTREQEKLNKLLNDGGKETDEAVKALRENIRLINEREAAWEKMNDAISKIVAEDRAGKPLIDTSALDQASKDIDDDINKRIKGLTEADRKEREARNKTQDERLEGIRKEAKAFRNMIDEITAELNKPPGPESGLTWMRNRLDQIRESGIAPMPRVKELGDAVKGLYQSADFRGVLALGPANTLAQQQLDTQNDILTELQGLHRTIGAAEGLLWG